MAELVNLLVPAEVVPRLSMTDGAVGTTAAVRGGGVYVRGVPVSLAEEWMAQNPGVQAIKRRPAGRWFRPRVYTYASVGFLILAVQAVIVLAVDGVGGLCGSGSAVDARRAEGAVLRPLRIDVDPLVIARRLRELVDPLLCDLDPARGAEGVADVHRRDLMQILRRALRALRGRHS